jgi:hypothetical protein
MSDAVLGCFERLGWPAGPEANPADVAATGPRVDVASRLRALWQHP